MFVPILYHVGVGVNGNEVFGKHDIYLFMFHWQGEKRKEMALIDANTFFLFIVPNVCSASMFKFHLKVLFKEG